MEIFKSSIKVNINEKEFKKLLQPYMEFDTEDFKRELHEYINNYIQSLTDTDSCTCFDEYNKMELDITIY